MIRMSKNKEYTCLCGQEATVIRPLMPFDPLVVSFLSEVSATLLKTPRAKAFPDVITFAFFCRKANLEQLKKPYENRLEGRIGRGLSFHIAPSNVPINFAYSMLSALLAGNHCVVKASSQDFEQTHLVCHAINSVLALPAYETLSSYVQVITYSRDRQDITETFSALCDARIIWGGDETVRRVRMASIPPRAVDIAFADRYSLLVIDCDTLCQMDQKTLAKMAQGFYNDTYLTDQNACTSPRLIYWIGQGSSVQEAKERFWSAIHQEVKKRYLLADVVAVDKLMAIYHASLKCVGAKQIPMPDHLITRAQIDALNDAIEEVKSPGGFFLEYTDTSLDALRLVVKPKYQTLSYIGMDKDVLASFVLTNGLRGIDRIVPVGHTMDFSLTWDGYDLIDTLSRSLQTL